MTANMNSADDGGIERQSETASRMDTNTYVDGDGNPPLLELENLNVTFETRRGDVEAVNGVDLTVNAGEIVCLVGESGSGKSVTAQSALDLIPQPPGIITGEIRYRGQDLRQCSQRAIRELRGDDIGIIFQDPMSSLNPVHTVGHQIVEALTAHNRWSGDTARERAIELMENVGIPDPSNRFGDYPFEFSGGMRQRVMIAIALANEPDLLIADEATTALDVTIEAQVIELIRDLRDKTDMGIVFITHDFGVVAEIADRVAVMYSGNIVERGDVFDVFDKPKHPYTKGLLGSIPGSGVQTDADRLQAVEGEPPDMTNQPSGCEFHPRCPEVMDVCRKTIPPTYNVGKMNQHDHHTRCLLYDNAPIVGQNEKKRGESE